MKYTIGGWPPKEDDLPTLLRGLATAMENEESHLRGVWLAARKGDDPTARELTKAAGDWRKERKIITRELKRRRFMR